MNMNYKCVHVKLYVGGDVGGAMVWQNGKLANTTKTINFHLLFRFNSLFNISYLVGLLEKDVEKRVKQFVIFLEISYPY